MTILNRPVRFLIVGLGKMGLNHLAAINKSNTAVVVGVLDSEPDRSVFSQGLPFYCNISSIPDNYDAVIIATPASHHAKLAMYFLNKGKHCLVEKPASLCIEDLQCMLDTANRGNTILAVGHIERFNDTIISVMDNTPAIERVEIVRKSVVDSDFIDTDVVNDLMIHDFDWIIQKEKHRIEDIEISVTQAATKSEKLSSVACALSFKNRRYSVLAELNAPKRLRTLSTAIAGQKLQTYDITNRNKMSEQQDPLYKQLNSFVNKCKGKAALIADGNAALGVMRIENEVRDKAYELLKQEISIC